MAIDPSYIYTLIMAVILISKVHLIFYFRSQEIDKLKYIIACTLYFVSFQVNNIYFFIYTNRQSQEVETKRNFIDYFTTLNLNLFKFVNIEREEFN